MSLSEIYPLIGATLQGVVVAAVVLLALFIGASIGLDFTKLRPGGARTKTVRTLEEAMGQPVVYLPADTPRGTTDQLANSRRPA